MYSVESCPVCSSNSFIDSGKAKDYTVSHETFQLKRCTRCDFLITSPRPPDNLLGKYYLSDTYVSHTAKASTLFDKLYENVRNQALKWKFTLVNKSSPKQHSSILDFGCGTGFFLKKMKESGYNIAGVEPSSMARANAEKITNSKIYSGINEIENNFDVITLWHVLEHVSNLNEVITQLKERLKKNGTLFIAVPNHKSADAQIYGMMWAGYDVPRHLWHFEQKTMQQLLNKHQLKIIDTIPMKLDAFYVSMLSEKNLSNGQSIITFTKGFFNGLLSNFKAKSNNYSSIIYIARHE
jgi:2-polyprenyl-3-methyl-5-hydroxy-6-metoxy-1,4-benzoquinol methylase